VNLVRLGTSLIVLSLGCSQSLLAQQSAAKAIVPLRKLPAQTSTFRAYVPFPFVLANQTLPAGTYQLQRLLGKSLETDEIGVIVVRGADPGVYKAVVTNLLPQPPDLLSNSQLVFARHAGQRYLTEVRFEGEKGHHIPNAPGESLGFDPSREEVALVRLH